MCESIVGISGLFGHRTIGVLGVLEAGIQDVRLLCKIQAIRHAEVVRE